MGSSVEAEKSVCCHFCGKKQDDVHLMIRGPAEHICSECVVLCMTIVEEKDGTIALPVYRNVMEENKRMREALLKAESTIGNFRQKVNEMSTLLEV